MKSSNTVKDWQRWLPQRTYLRTNGCLEEVMLDELSTGPKPLAATGLGSVGGNAVGGGLVNGLDDGV